jgi:hypothetical protein
MSAVTAATASRAMTTGTLIFIVGAHSINAALQGVVEDALVEAHQGIRGLVLVAATTRPCTARPVRNDSI